MANRLLTTLLASLAIAAAASAGMPAPQQNAMVAKYCGVCHSDAHPNGGISFERFNAAHPDPGVAAMIVSKLKGKALGASGQPLPDKATQNAFLEAMVAESAGANRWAVSREPVLTAAIVRELPSTAKENDGIPDSYRLIVTCRPDTRAGEVRLAWSPGVPAQGRQMSAAIDAGAPRTYRIEGTETMGNGQKGDSGPGSIVLAPQLPRRALTVTNVFANEKVVFPFDELPAATRRQLSACF